MGKKNRDKNRKGDEVSAAAAVLNQAMQVTPLVAAFLKWIAEHRSENTLRMYTGRLKPFVTRFPMRTIDSLQPLEVDAYLDSVNKWPDGRSKAPDTIRANIIGLEQLEKFALKKRITQVAFIGEHEKPVGRLRERLPTPEEIEAIKSQASPAFRLIYQALRQSGARPNELARATVADWDQENSLIVLLHHKTARKTGRPRKIIVGDKLLRLIQEGLGDRQSGPLFLTPRGKQWTTDSLSQSFGRYRKAAKVQAGVVLYSARHEFATKLCEAVSADAAADALGHSGLNMIQRYVHRSKQTLKANQDAVSI